MSWLKTFHFGSTFIFSPLENMLFTMNHSPEAQTFTLRGWKHSESQHHQNSFCFSKGHLLQKFNFELSQHSWKILTAISSTNFLLLCYDMQGVEYTNMYSLTWKWMRWLIFFYPFERFGLMPKARVHFFWIVLVYFTFFIQLLCISYPAKEVLLK